MVAVRFSPPWDCDKRNQNAAQGSGGGRPVCFHVDRRGALSWPALEGRDKVYLAHPGSQGVPVSALGQDSRTHGEAAGPPPGQRGGLQGSRRESGRQEQKAIAFGVQVRSTSGLCGVPERSSHCRRDAPQENDKACQVNGQPGHHVLLGRGRS